MNGWGGRRPNQTGRPKKAEGQRTQELIRRFAALVKHVDKSACEEAVRKLEEMRDKG